MFIVILFWLDFYVYLKKAFSIQVVSVYIISITWSGSLYFLSCESLSSGGTVINSMPSLIIEGLFVKYYNSLGLYDLSYWMNYGIASNCVNFGRVYNNCYNCLAGDLPYQDVMFDDILCSFKLFNGFLVFIVTLFYCNCL